MQSLISDQPFDSKVTVNLLGKVYTLKGDVDSDHMVKVSKYVDQRLRELQEQLPGLDSGKLSLLVALNLADELFQARQDENHIDLDNLNKMASKTEDLIRMLENGMIGEDTYH